MKTGVRMGFLGLALVAGVSLAAGASLPGAGLRGLGALVLFGALGSLIQALWQSLAAPAAAPQAPAAGPQAPVSPQAPAVAPSNPAAGTIPGREQRGSLLDQALPAASPADLFQPLQPPTVTARQMEE